MRPVLFSLWGININGYGLMIGLGIVAAVLLFTNRASKEGYDEDSILNMIIIAIVSGVVGGKILYIITDIQAIIKEPEMLKNFGSGFVIYGSIIGGVLAFYLYCKRKAWNFIKVFDIAIPSLPLAQGFGRIGCFLAGCCYGAVTDLPIGVEFKNSPFAPSGVHLHPTQIYSSIFDFALAAFLLWYYKREHRQGRVFAMYMIIYSIGRFLVEFLRDDPRGAVGSLSTSQFISLFVLILGIGFYNLDKIKGRMVKVEK